MPGALPSILPTSNIRSQSTNGPRRAQNFSVSKLNQFVDREKAVVSVSQKMQSRSRPGNSTTSINKAGDDDEPSTSFARAGNARRTIYEDYEKNQEKALDVLRYQHIKQMMREKREEQKIAATIAKISTQSDVAESKTPTTQTAVKKSIFSVPGIKTGSGFRLKGATGLNRRLYQQVRKLRTVYNNITAQDRKYFLDMVGQHAKKVSPGTGFGRLTRNEMRRKVDTDWKAGKISAEDRDDFKKMINGLKG